jgi:Ca-activated chloride channel family protein
MKINQNSFIYTLIILFFSHYGFSQKDVKLLRHGNKLYDQGNYKEAEVDYRKALEINKESDKGKFNLGTAVYQEKNFNEATKIFEDLSGKQLDKSTKAKIFHNYGNSLLESKQYEQSIAAYKNSLLNNPADKDTKYNLEYARSMLKKQQQQQQQQDKNQDKKDQDKKDQNNKDKEQQNKDQNKNQSQDQNKKISKDDAERMLEALKNHEKKTMAKLKKSKANIQPTVIEKDW